MHNTLATSDYALLDRDTMTARPNYWAAVLWHRVMGRVVLASPASPSPQLRLYAQCLRGVPGGVGLMALNTGATAQTVRIGSTAQAWLMAAATVDARTITINGKSPDMDDHGVLTGLDPATVHGRVTIPGQAIAFVAVPRADNPACR